MGYIDFWANWSHIHQCHFHLLIAASLKLKLSDLKVILLYGQKNINSLMQFPAKVLLLHLDYSEWSRQSLMKRILELEKVSVNIHVAILTVSKQKM